MEAYTPPPKTLFIWFGNLMFSVVSRLEGKKENSDKRMALLIGTGHSEIADKRHLSVLEFGGLTFMLEKIEGGAQLKVEAAFTRGRQSIPSRL